MMRSGTKPVCRQGGQRIQNLLGAMALHIEAPCEGMGSRDIDVLSGCILRGERRLSPATWKTRWPQPASVGLLRERAGNVQILARKVVVNKQDVHSKASAK